MQIRQRPTLVLDTGPFLHLLCGWHFESNLVDAAARREALEAIYREIPPEPDDMLGWMRQAPRLLITSHVVTEALNLRGYSFPKQYEAQLRQAAINHVAEFEEQGVLLRDIDPKLVERYGVTDAALISLATHQPCILLTTDGRLLSSLPSDPRFEIRLAKNWKDPAT